MCIRDSIVAIAPHQRGEQFEELPVERFETHTLSLIHICAASSALTVTVTFTQSPAMAAISSSTTPRRLISWSSTFRMPSMYRDVYKRQGGRRTALYDKTGTEVMSFEGEQSATLQNGLLVLQESRLIEMCIRDSLTAVGALSGRWCVHF